MLHFARPDLAIEFDRLGQENAPLAGILRSLAGWMPGVCVTSIFRPRDRVFGGGTKKLSPHAACHAADARECEDTGFRASPHMFWQAVDIRCTTWSPAEIEGIVGFLRRHDAHNHLPEIAVSGSRTRTR